ncbi:pilus assembly protein PilF [Allofrancisella guangzhouensis]|uniref:Pilus assembly protein PilF n=1 Tax=Allofrancisella guangzhouensis TaxID=594679 RepID=A0A0A8E5A4_9GAMM|nr:CDC27 family protein [Allofrancisella guangzhouensis]AJC49173.1 pilus assembly protein PilF [Allofrancisella guangzhouensis]MBK2026769.1 pilus assembly protein PilF [Allofrancisella guangzhouensis]MBK2044441.1 pilus assembly protein PilF [Allofrancisella guangzhouensis]MBK2045351.1 pilus assembly protein PilF [Allofrancisella guangzhouensis]
MQANLKKISLLVGLLGVLGACSTLEPNNSSYQQNSIQGEQKKSPQLVEGNVVEYTVPARATEQKADYKKATTLNAELAIIYSHDGYLDRAKNKLIKAQQLAKEHGYKLAIVDYAAGYYYQTIGANSIAEKYYKDAIYNQPKNFEAMNFYAQFLCQVKGNYTEAEHLFDKSLYVSNNNDMAQTFFLYSECMYKQGKEKDALDFMEKADKFRTNYLGAKLRLAEMYFEQRKYKECYKVIYEMKDNGEFFNNKRVLKLRLKLAEYTHNKDEAATVRLIFSSKDFNDDNIDQFFSASDGGIE